MQEKIGNVVLDYQFYPGEDFYSDGAVEDEMLDIAMHYPQEEYNQVIGTRKSWPILYHFSQIRQNILEWVPITKEDSVLEIGAGCGAITGVLARKAGHVTCIDLSKKRSMINAYRHRDADNMKIMVGNFQDIEKNLTEKFDYITLIGVFEYAQGYIGTDNPYVDMLKSISRHLKPNGRILIAIENRLGMKYLAGCTEDHEGTYFEGIEGYPGAGGVRTFSKPELEQIIRDAGFDKTEFYYPYPDYKLPLSVFSDEYLPKKGELRANMNNFDRKRMLLFDEARAFDALAESKQFPMFSNSFFAIIGGDTDTETLYSKYSNERDRRFAIRTDIMLRDGQRFVEKSACYPEGKTHIANISKWYERLTAQYTGTKITINKCRKSEAGVELDYLHGVTLEHILDGYVQKNQLEEVEERLFAYIGEVKKADKGRVFEMTDSFRDVFGNEELPENLTCMSVTDIDMVLNNVIVGEGYELIDYEWTFDFPIPVNFVIYRILHYYLYGSSARTALYGLNLMEKAGITLQEQEVYARMEEHFQKSYVVGTYHTLPSLYPEISPGHVNVQEILHKDAHQASVQIFVDEGNGFSEAGSRFVEIGSDGVAEVTVALDAKVRAVRIDPAMESCLVRVETLGTDKKKLSYKTNGKKIAGGEYVFYTDDPQIVVGKIPSGSTVLEAKLRIGMLGEGFNR